MENSKVKCPHCGREYSKMGIGTHIWRSHGQGRHFSPNTGKSTWNKGKKLSEEYKQKIRESVKKNCGHAHTEESKKKIIRSRKEK